MNADVRTLIETLRDRGISFRLDGERIKVVAPAEPDAETKAMLDELRRRREEVRVALAAPIVQVVLVQTEPGPCPNCSAALTPTRDIYNREWWECLRCATWA